MAATFPGGVWIGYTVVDLVSFWNAATANPISEEIVAVETFLISTVRADGFVLAGPASGGPLAPTWRALVGTDVPEATDAARGTIEMATDVETTTGTATDRALTPANLRSDVPLLPAALKGVRLDASGNLIMPEDGRTEHVGTAANLFNNLTMYSATNGHQWTQAFRKSHQDTVGHTVTVTGESLGNITWDGNSGAAFTEAAYIEALQNGAAGVNTPADLVFYTSDGTGAPAEALRITKDGDLQVVTGSNIGIGVASERIEFYAAGYVAVVGALLGVGNVAPSVRLHVTQDGVGLASEPAWTAAVDALVVEAQATKNVSIQILSDNNQGGTLGFADTDARNRAYISYDHAAELLTLAANGAARMYIDSNGNVGVGSTAGPTANGGKVLFFGDNTADPTMGNNTAGFYGKDVAGTVEAFAVDEAGNAAQLTAHNYELFAPIAGTLHWAPSHTNHYAGQQKVYDMERALLALEALTGETFVHSRQLPASERRNWAQDQRTQQRAAFARGESFKKKSKPKWMK